MKYNIIFSLKHYIRNITTKSANLCKFFSTNSEGTKVNNKNSKKNNYNINSNSKNLSDEDVKKIEKFITHSNSIKRKGFSKNSNKNLEEISNVIRSNQTSTMEDIQSRNFLKLNHQIELDETKSSSKELNAESIDIQNLNLRERILFDIIKNIQMKSISKNNTTKLENKTKIKKEEISQNKENIFNVDLDVDTLLNLKENILVYEINKLRKGDLSKFSKAYYFFSALLLYINALYILSFKLMFEINFSSILVTTTNILTFSILYFLTTITHDVVTQISVDPKTRKIYLTINKNGILKHFQRITILEASIHDLVFIEKGNIIGKDNYVFYVKENKNVLYTILSDGIIFQEKLFNFLIALNNKEQSI